MTICAECQHMIAPGTLHATDCVTATMRYAYRKGSRHYPGGIAGPFDTIEEARAAAQEDRNYGGSTGRIVKRTMAEIEKARKDIAWGMLPSGW